MPTEKKKCRQSAKRTVSVAGGATAGIMHIVFGVVIFVATLGYLFGYFIPTAIAIYRKVKSQNGIFLVNLFLGWTFLGWIVALIWAFTGEQTEEAKLAKSQVQAELEMVLCGAKEKAPVASGELLSAILCWQCF